VARNGPPDHFARQRESPLTPFFARRKKRKIRHEIAPAVFRLTHAALLDRTALCAARRRRNASLKSGIR
jgi:hypothetical protein